MLNAIGDNVRDALDKLDKTVDDILEDCRTTR